MATGAPGTNGVWQYGEDDSEATFSALLNKVASTTDTQIGTDRGRLTTLEARKLSGLVPVVPTSVNLSSGSATISTDGQVTLSSGSTTYVRLNGVFTNAYDYYVIHFEGIAPSAEWVNFQLSNSGVDNTSSYNFGGMYNDASSIGFQGGALSATYGRFTYMGFDGSSVVSNVFGTRSTTFPARLLSTGSYGGGTSTSYFGKHNTAATTFDGIKIFHATSTFTSFRVQVYGGNK
jgi:hypothetical protein